MAVYVRISKRNGYTTNLLLLAPEVHVNAGHLQTDLLVGRSRVHWRGHLKEAVERFL